MSLAARRVETGSMTEYPNNKFGDLYCYVLRIRSAVWPDLEVRIVKA